MKIHLRFSLLQSNPKLCESLITISDKMKYQDAIKMVECPICSEESMNKDFPTHNPNCFRQSNNIGDTFFFPPGRTLFNIKQNSFGDTVVVDAKKIPMVGQDEYEEVAFNCFSFSCGSLKKATWMKIVMMCRDEPIFKMELQVLLAESPYEEDKVAIKFPVRKMDEAILTFEMFQP